MKSLKLLGFSASFFFTLLFLVSGCLGNYGKIRLASGDHNTTIQQIKENWENYDILYAGLSTDSPSAIMFGPRNDGKRLMGKKWMPVTDAAVLDEIVDWLESYINFPPTLYEILSPEGVFFGYIYTSSTEQIVVKQVDPETLELENIPLPPIDYGPGGGERKMDPIIAIVGRPNVGKSTLFNRLTRTKSALVDNRPGITRDRLQGTINHEGIRMSLVDTGGFEDLGQDPLQKGVRTQVETAIQEADSVIFMVDGREGVLPGDEEMAQILRRTRKKVFLSANKIDGPEHDHLINDFYQLGYETVYGISAAHGYGIKALLHELVKGLDPSPGMPPPPDQIRIAVLGKPNVGKSSLINRILKTNRLVVSELPGTTRDTVDSPFSYGGKEYLLIDTAGIRRKSRVKEKIDTFSMIKAIKSLDRCHVAVLLLDGSEGVSDQDARICGYAFEKNRGLVLGVNKWDLVKGDKSKKDLLEKGMERQLKFVSFAPRINMSALTGERVIQLFSKIDTVYDQFSTRISTAIVNRAIQQIIEKHPAPRIGRGRLKFYYATQSRTKPPTFTAFVNRPDMLHFSYERFLVNQLRLHLGLTRTPIKLVIRKR